MNIVLDTNTVIFGLFWKGASAREDRRGTTPPRSRTVAPVILLPWSFLMLSSCRILHTDSLIPVFFPKQFMEIRAKL
jgi:hypothetical protein